MSERALPVSMVEVFLKTREIPLPRPVYELHLRIYAVNLKIRIRAELHMHKRRTLNPRSPVLVPLRCATLGLWATRGLDVAAVREDMVA